MTERVDCFFQNLRHSGEEVWHQAKWVIEVPLNGMSTRFTQYSCGQHLSFCLEAYPVSAVIALKFYQESRLKGALIDFDEEAVEVFTEDENDD